MSVLQLFISRLSIILFKILEQVDENSLNLSTALHEEYFG